MRNVAAEGIDILCYNFMPVVDWTRTDLDFEWGDGSKALKFDATAFSAFDIFILGRAGARKDYTEKQVFAALRRSLARGSSSRIGVSWEGESSKKENVGEFDFLSIHTKRNSSSVHHDILDTMVFRFVQS